MDVAPVDFTARAAEALASGRFDLVPEAEARRVLGAAIRLHAARCEAQGATEPVEAGTLTPTEIMVVVSDLLHGANLNLFDMAMWFRRAE